MSEPLNASQYFGLAIPAFFFFMIVELILEKVKKKNNYRMSDSLTNISSGIGSQIGNIFIKSILVVAFAYIYEHYALFNIEINWINGILLFLLFDFCFYWAHRLGHEVNFLWAAHIVHHQSEEFNLSVALRQPWLSDILTIFVFIPIPLLGFSPEFLVPVASFDILYQFIIHTKYVGKLHPVIEYIFNTPSHHRIHHAVNKQYIDKNYGGVLIIWDRLFKSFTEEKEEPLYGITTPFKSRNPLWANLHYWVELFSLSDKSKKFADKILVFFSRPGWQPKELGGYQPPKEINKSNYFKFDVRIEEALKVYVLSHYVILLILTALFLNFYKEFTLYECIFPSVVILFNTIVLGALTENKPWGMLAEYLRLLLTSAAGFYYCLAYDFGFNYVLIITIALALIVSLIWYRYINHKWVIQSAQSILTYVRQYIENEE
jgi:sterol desaturase/sphingolipid hydroxylase (fatty acid hydroxylase superfamily)